MCKIGDVLGGNGRHSRLMCKVRGAALRMALTSSRQRTLNCPAFEDMPMDMALPLDGPHRCPLDNLTLQEDIDNDERHSGNGRTGKHHRPIAG